MSLAVRKLTPTFGIELLDCDVAALDDAGREAVRAHWLESGLLLFRDQSLAEADLVGFSRFFGELEIHVRREYLSPDNPEVLIVSNVLRPDGTPMGILADRDVIWHHDQIYRTHPAVGSFLYAVKVPPEGGRTFFADLAGAYDALPETLKKRIAGKRATHSYEYFSNRVKEPRQAYHKARTPDVTHPIVRTHPYTGRKALYVDSGMTTAIVGLDPAESDALLEELFAFSTGPEFVYAHEWRVGDALMWDNATTIHRREAFDGRHERIMKRTTILPRTDLAVPF